MPKIPIRGSQFSDTDLEYEVCSHLSPILTVLESQGNTYDPLLPLYHDKYSEVQRLLDKQIDFDLIDKTFEIPGFILLNRERGTILCQTCWCAIVGMKSENWD